LSRRTEAPLCSLGSLCGKLWASSRRNACGHLHHAAWGGGKALGSLCLNQTVGLLTDAGNLTLELLTACLASLCSEGTLTLCFALVRVRCSLQGGKVCTDVGDLAGQAIYAATDLLTKLGLPGHQTCLPCEKGARIALCRRADRLFQVRYASLHAANLSANACDLRAYAFNLRTYAFNLRTNVAHFRHQAALTGKQISLPRARRADCCTETCDTFLHRADIRGQASHVTL
jgi:hypothetical protein